MAAKLCLMVELSRETGALVEDLTPRQQELLALLYSPPDDMLAPRLDAAPLRQELSELADLLLVVVQRTSSRLAINLAIAALHWAQRYNDGVTLIYQRFGDSLRRHIRGALCDRDEGDELFGKVMVAVQEGFPAFAHRSTARVWVFRIAHHQILKRKARYSYRFRVALGSGAFSALPSRPTGPQRLSDDRLLVCQIAARLGPDERELVLLRFEQDLTFDEIAAVLAISAESAKKRFQRALTKLQVFSKKQCSG